MKELFFASASHACATVLRSAGLGLIIVALSSTVRASSALAPEIDAGSLVSGLTILAGGVLIVTNRIRRK